MGIEAVWAMGIFEERYGVKAIKMLFRGSQDAEAREKVREVISSVCRGDFGAFRR